MSRLSLPVGPRDHVNGPVDAPLTLLEYGSYANPRCSQAHQIVVALQQRLGIELQFVFRHFPLTDIYPGAQYAAEAAEAAGVQGRFWEFHSYLLEQTHISHTWLLQYAATLGLDLDRFERDIAEHVHTAHIDEDVMSGLRSGVNGTPTFFINGIRFDGVCDLERMFDALNSVRTAAGRDRDQS